MVVSLPSDKPNLILPLARFRTGFFFVPKKIKTDCVCKPDIFEKLNSLRQGWFPRSDKSFHLPQKYLNGYNWRNRRAFFWNVSGCPPKGPGHHSTSIKGLITDILPVMNAFPPDSLCCLVNSFNCRPDSQSFGCYS